MKYLIQELVEIQFLRQLMGLLLSIVEDILVTLDKYYNMHMGRVSDQNAHLCAFC